MLRSGGLLFFRDAIFEQTDAEANISRWIDKLGEIGGTQLRDEVVTHVREEFSTFDWNMDGSTLPGTGPGSPRRGRYLSLVMLVQVGAAEVEYHEVVRPF